MYDIISIGSATFDVFIKSSKFPLDRMSIGRKIEADEFVYASGGGGTNTATGFARLGLKTACVARFGDDLFGNFVLKDLDSENFDKKYLVRKTGDSTDYSTVLINPDGSRIILVYRGKTCIDKETFPWDALTQTKNLYIASVEGNVDLLIELVGRAAKAGVNIFINPGSREIKEKQKILALLPRVKALILNKEEAEDLGIDGNLPTIKPEMLIITNGRQGAKYMVGDKQYFIDVVQTTVVDETGAGDAFSAGFVTGIIKGFPPERALKLGMANGASVVSKMGSKPGLLYEEDIALWIDKRK